MSNFNLKNNIVAYSIDVSVVLLRTNDFVLSSSRSQCIINIRGSPHSAVFTVVDLAGAEREKRTGNQVPTFCPTC